MLDVTAIGELLIDFTCQAIDAGGYPTMAAHPGGAPANYLAALAKFGSRTALLSKVGNDAFGHMLINTLNAAGIESAGLILDGNVFTTLAFVTLDPTGDREFSFSRKPGADTQLTWEELNLNLIDTSRVLHFGTLSLTDEPSRTATRKAVAYAKARGKLISCDPNLRKPLWKDPAQAKEEMLWSLMQADIVKISEEELDFLWGLSPKEGAAKLLEEYSVSLVFATCGAQGCYFANGRAAGHVAGLAGIKVMDTTGAGDIFGGSAMWKLLQLGKEPRELDEAELQAIASFACTAAGLSTTRPGGISSVPSLEEVNANMDALQ